MFLALKDGEFSSSFLFSGYGEGTQKQQRPMGGATNTALCVPAQTAPKRLNGRASNPHAETVFPR